jgi:hypothetical protein
VPSRQVIGDCKDGRSDGDDERDETETVHGTLLLGDRVSEPFGLECNTRLTAVSIYFSLRCLARLYENRSNELHR